MGYRPRDRFRNMNTRLIISLLCAGALAFACGPRSHSEGSTSLAAALPTKALSASFAAREQGQTAGTADHKKTSAKTDARIDSKLNVFIAQHDVRLALDVRNAGGKHAELTFPSGQTHDFFVVDSTGREVWRWSKSRMFTQGVQNRQLGSGDALQLSETWKDGAKPGRYTAVAVLKSSNYPQEQRVDFVMQ
jgi:hypothetical protein